jgi:uncharacterized protein VirK/YbjX
MTNIVFTRNSALDTLRYIALCYATLVSQHASKVPSFAPLPRPLDSGSKRAMKLHEGWTQRLVALATPSVTISSGVSRELKTVPYLRELFKLKARSLVHRAHTRRWLHLLNSHPAFSEYVLHCPRLLYKIYRPYLTNTLPIEERLAVLASHYQFVFRRGLGQTVAQASHAGVTLAAIEGKTGTRYEISLRAVGTLEREGEMVLQLVQASAPLCSIAFTFAHRDGSDVVSVGCLQGGNGGDTLDAIRHATRELHGLRPKQLLVTLVRQLGHAFGCQELRLVSNANRVVRGAMRQGRVSADYDQLWTELGAQRRHDGDFSLRCETLRAPCMESIASKKRAEARRRHEVVAALCAGVTAGLK